MEGERGLSQLNVSNRHRAIQDVARRFDGDHLRDPDARQISTDYARLAAVTLARLPDDPETTRALTLLADSRDAAIRAKIYQSRV
jgi:hypothetical protein